MSDGLPLQKNATMRFAGRTVLKFLGWKIIGPFPDVPKAVVIVAPHTSNWDFVIGSAAKFALQLQIHWFGKHTLFRQPFTAVLRWMGGIPIKRSSSTGIVQQTVVVFQNHDQFLLGLSPEGTRKRVDRWKTGFYHIAIEAGVPIVPVAFDYSKKEVVIGTPVVPSDSIERDFSIFRKFYTGMEGKIPENFSLQFN